jgi:hypothetical protein
VKGEVALALVLAAAGAARADVPASPKYQPPIPAPPPSPPDRTAIDQASDANFEDDAPHHGFRIGVAAGGGFQLGGVDSSTGGGGGTSVRLGAAASRRTAIVFAIDAMKIAGKDAKGQTSSLADNTSLAITVGPQVYLREALWLRGGVGVASFNTKPAGAVAGGQQLYGGLGGVFGIGVDLKHWERVGISLEVNSLGAIFDGHLVVGGFVGLGVHYD